MSLLSRLQLILTPRGNGHHKPVGRNRILHWLQLVGQQEWAKKRNRWQRVGTWLGAALCPKDREVKETLETPG